MRSGPLGRPEKALAIFDRILALNPNDNQGVRFCREPLMRGRSWQSYREAEALEWS